MKTIKDRPVIVFLLLAMIISIPLLTVHIPIFDGEIEIQSQWQHMTLPARLSLSYFLGFHISSEDMHNVSSMRLLPSGYLLAGILMIGLPVLVAYRLKVAKK